MQFDSVDYPDDYMNEVVALASILTDCIIDKSYRAPIEVNSLIHLSKAGEAVLAEAKRMAGSVAEQELRLALFLEIFHDEPLIAEDLDLTEIQKVFSLQIKAREIRYPYIFGTSLFDRYYEMFDADPLTLNTRSTARLLDGMPQGVFQEGPYVVGPFGILRSSTLRYFQATTEVHLRQCSDPGCRNLHPVNLSTNAEALINKKARTKIGKALERRPALNTAYLDYLRLQSPTRRAFYNVDAPLLLPFLLGDALTFEERDSVLRAAYGINEGSVRSKFCDELDRSGSPDQLFAFGDEAEQLQATLLLEDSLIVASLDKCAWEGRIPLPLAEVRTTMAGRRVTAGLYDTVPQLSFLGYRHTDPANVSLGFERLRLAITDMYDLTDKDEAEEFDWVTREFTQVDLNDRLNQLLWKGSPRDIVRRVVLSRPRNLRVAASRLLLDEDLLRTMTDDQLIDLILWKCGFTSDLPSGDAQRVYALLDQFLDSAKVGETPSEDQREVIRGFAVSFFVALERLLDLSVSFSTWATLNDHYGDSPRFTFELQAARQVMARELNRSDVMGGGGDPILSSAGTNALYALCTGFRRLARRISLARDGVSSDVRPASERPGFVPFAPSGFAFNHRTPVNDMRTEDVAGLLAACIEFSRVLSAIDVPNLRNRLEHSGRDFPTPIEIVDALERLRLALGQAEDAGLIPSLFQEKSSDRDQFGRITFTLENYRGDRMLLSSVDPLLSTGFPAPGVHQYALHTTRVADTLDYWRFRLADDSDYSRSRRDFPPAREREGETKKSLSAGTVSGARSA